MVDDTTMDDLKLLVNEDALPLTVTRDESGGRLYSTVIPRDTLAKQGAATAIVLTLDHISPVPDAPANVRLGFALDGLHIRPAN